MLSVVRCLMCVVYRPLLFDRRGLVSVVVYSLCVVCVLLFRVVCCVFVDVCWPLCCVYGVLCCVCCVLHTC